MVEVIDSGGGAERTATLTEPVVNLDLTGRVAVVTGGASGIGLACARGLSEAGADVMVASPFEAEQARVHNITEDEVLRAVFLAMTSVNRLATVAEVAELRASLSSSAASHVSGASLTVTVVGRPVEREASP